MNDSSIPSPHPTLTTLVPFLFSPDDALSPTPSFISKPTLQAIHYLSLTPEDDRYWTLGNKDSEVLLARREIVESGLIDSIELCSAQYSFDLEGELKALIPVSLPSSSPVLDVILLYEVPDKPETDAGEEGKVQGEARWTFMKLSAPSLIRSPNNGFHALRQGGNSSAGRSTTTASQVQWFPTVREAIESVAKKVDLNPTDALRNRPPGLDFSRQDSTYDNGGDEDDECDEYGTRRQKASSTNRIKTREEMAEGEGTTPGAYGDSNDFWAGWSDGEDEDAGAGDSGVGFVNDTRGRDIEKEDDEDDYWKGYGGVTNQVDDGREDLPTTTAPPPVPPASESPASTNKVKTRSRRSSTVTPFKLSSSSLTPAPIPTTSDTTSSTFTASETTRNPSTSSPLLDSASPPTSSSTVPATTQLLAPIASLSDATNQATSPEDADQSLRFALAGIWGLYKGPIEGREERMKRFERIAAEVVRS
ncbi:hypothetical protein JCM16303_006326 [Sporobolomyces ruberrimus]